MTHPLLYLLFITFLMSMIFFIIVITYFSNRRKRKVRLEKYDLIDNFNKQKKKEENRQQDSTLKKLGIFIEKVINLSKNEHLLIQSGLRITLGELFISRIVVAIIGIAIANLYQLHFVFIILCAVIGFQLPLMYVKRKRKKRLSMCSEQLGEALGTMANALRAGFSFMQAINMVAREIKDPLGPEFMKAIQEINYGVSVEDAFQGLLERLPDKELAIVLNTLIIQRTSGGNLAFLLETMQETIIDRTRVKDEVKTLTAQGKMSSIIITLLPIALALYLRFVNPEYFLVLFSHPIGWLMVIVGSINIILGWLFIKKIVHIEV